MRVSSRLARQCRLTATLRKRWRPPVGSPRQARERRTRPTQRAGTPRKVHAWISLVPVSSSLRPGSCVGRQIASCHSFASRSIVDPHAPSCIQQAGRGDSGASVRARAAQTTAPGELGELAWRLNGAAFALTKWSLASERPDGCCSSSAGPGRVAGEILLR